MPTTQASPAVGATRPLRRRCDGEGGTSHQTQSPKRVRAKLMPLPSYRKRIFWSAVKVKPSARKRDLTEIEYPLLVKRVFIPSPPPRLRQASPDGHRRRCESAMPTTQASPAVGATRPLRRRAATGRGGTSHQTQSSKRVRAKLMPLPSYRKRIFSSAVKVKPFWRASATLTEIEYPLLVKRVFAIPLPATAATPLSPRRPPPPMRVGYADHAGVAGRRGYAPATQARCDGEGGTSHQTQLQEGKGKTDALTLLSQAYFSAVKVKPFGAQARPDRDRIPAFSKSGYSSIPSPATAATPLSPDGHRRRCESAMPTTQASPAVGATRPLRRRAATGREGFHQTQSSRG